MGNVPAAAMQLRYKARLHELCQQNRWEKPTCTVRREGPDHAPTFHATITVNSAEYQTPKKGVPTIKRAQDLAAMVALFAHQWPPRPPQSGGAEFHPPEEGTVASAAMLGLSVVLSPPLPPQPGGLDYSLFFFSS
jgi:hypothetical protein